MEPSRISARSSPRKMGNWSSPIPNGCGWHELEALMMSMLEQDNVDKKQAQKNRNACSCMLRI